MVGGVRDGDDGPRGFLRLFRATLRGMKNLVKLCFPCFNFPLFPSNLWPSRTFIVYALSFCDGILLIY